MNASKNILITGVSSGIGRAAAIHLIKKGYRVWGIARRENLLKELFQEIQSPLFSYRICNVDHQEEIIKLFLEMEKEGFFPDVIILNAGILIDEIFPYDNFKIWEEQFSVNFFAPLFFVQFFLKEFLRRGNGHFIAINTTAAIRPNRRSLAYSSSKAALAMAFKGFRSFLKNRDLFFSTLYLGPIATAMWEGKKNFFVGEDKKAAFIISKIIQNKKRVSYYPYVSTGLFRLGYWIPDNVFIKARKFIFG